jgi:hypothetical protein
VKPATGVDLFNVDMNARAEAVQQEAPLSLFVLSHRFIEKPDTLLSPML